MIDLVDPWTSSRLNQYSSPLQKETRCLMSGFFITAHIFRFVECVPLIAHTFAFAHTHTRTQCKAHVQSALSTLYILSWSIRLQKDSKRNKLYYNTQMITWRRNIVFFFILLLTTFESPPVYTFTYSRIIVARLFDFQPKGTGFDAQYLPSSCRLLWPATCLL